MNDLQAKVSALLGREAEVEKLSTGKYVVLWLSFSSSPPPVGDTEEEALEKFIQWYKEDSDDRSGDTTVNADSAEDKTTSIPS